MENEALIEYFTNLGKDSNNRVHNDILRFSDEEMEKCHDFIQWFFPTITPSAYDNLAPLLNQETIELLKDDAVFQARFSMGLKRIFRFWRLQYRGDGKNLILLNISSKRFWMEYDNHNLLRMSRVMESCRLLGFEEVARSLFEVLFITIKTHPEFYFITPENCFHWYISAFSGPLVSK